MLQAWCHIMLLYCPLAVTNGRCREDDNNSRVSSPLNHRRKSEGLLWPFLDHFGILAAPYTLHLCPGCSPDTSIQDILITHQSTQWKLTNNNKYDLTTAFLVFCLIGFSLDAHRGGTMSRSVFFSLSMLGLAAGSFNSLLWGGWKSAPDVFSLYESELEGRLWCMYWGFTPRPVGLSVQELWTPKGPLLLWKLPPLLLWALLSVGLCPEAEKEKQIFVDFHCV